MRGFPIKMALIHPCLRDVRVSLSETKLASSTITVSKVNPHFSKAWLCKENEAVTTMLALFRAAWVFYRPSGSVLGCAHEYFLFKSFLLTDSPTRAILYCLSKGASKSSIRSMAWAQGDTIRILEAGGISLVSGIFIVINLSDSFDVG